MKSTVLFFGAVLAILVATLLVIFVLTPTRAASAAPWDGDCTAVQRELSGELASMQDWHRRWALHLQAHPWEKAWSHIVSAEAQWFWVEQYEYRLRAVWWAANGNQAWVSWLVEHLKWAQGGHVAIRDRLLREPWDPLNETVDGVAGQEQMIRLYDWRLWMVQRLTEVC